MRHLGRGNAGYADGMAPPTPKAGPRFKIHGAIIMQAHAVGLIIARSYPLYPQQTTGASQVAAALRTDRVQSAAGFRGAVSVQFGAMPGGSIDSTPPCPPPAFS